MENHQAYTLASIIVGALEPMCQSIEIAGSIRRGVPHVNDVDLVVLPKPGQAEAIKHRARARCRVVTDGPQTLIVALPLPSSYQHTSREIQIDIWFAHPSGRNLFEEEPGNWGSLLLCRTGSKEHNIRLCERAKGMGLHWDPYKGVTKDGRIIASESEADVFRALGLETIPPGFREAGQPWTDYDLLLRRRSTPVPPKPVPVSPKDAERLFARMQAICAQRGAEAKQRCAAQEAGQ
jgi:DNA polymerase (family 10)